MDEKGNNAHWQAGKGSKSDQHQSDSSQKTREEDDALLKSLQELAIRITRSKEREYQEYRTLRKANSVA